MAFIADSIFDLALAGLTGVGDRIDICSQEPTNYSQATTGGTYSLGNGTTTVPAASDGATSGRRVIVGAVTAGSVTDTGTATHWALTDGASALLATGALASSQAVTSGNTFNLAAFSITFPDAA